MKITIGSDHAGFALKKVLIEHLQKSGHQLVDVGTDSTAPVDYPDYAEAVARGVLQGGAERGILICGSGVALLSRQIRSQASAPACAMTPTPRTRAWSMTT